MNCKLKAYLNPLRGRLPKVDRDALAAQAAALRDHAGILLDRADDFAQYSVEKARTFSVLDFAFLKVCILSLGIWLGSMFSKFFRRFRVVVFFGFVISYLYLIWRIFFRED